MRMPLIGVWDKTTTSKRNTISLITKGITIPQTITATKWVIL